MIILPGISYSAVNIRLMIETENQRACDFYSAVSSIAYCCSIEYFEKFPYSFYCHYGTIV